MRLRLLLFPREEQIVAQLNLCRKKYNIRTLVISGVDKRGNIQGTVPYHKSVALFLSEERYKQVNFNYPRVV